LTTLRGQERREDSSLLVDGTGQRAAAEFVWRKLRGHDLRLLEWFKLLPLQGKYVLRGLCRYPVRAAARSRELRQGYRVTASANVLRHLYPHPYSLAVGTVSREAGSRSSSRRGWSYLIEEVTLRDSAEALILVAGHEAFHFLRHSRQIDGRNTEPGANRYGLAWLREWREAVAAPGARPAPLRRDSRHRLSVQPQIPLPFP
jgi:hypothetical protein